MPRSKRFDAPGTFHHVFNRGIARRTAFEGRVDARYFLACLAREVRRGAVRVHAFAILTTHFHLLVESRDGRLGAAMKRAINVYVRAFNRSRRRDGPLFRGRFGSRLVSSVEYRRTLVRYIDRNAPAARLASSTAAYPFGSAALFCALRRPLWLATEWVDAEMGEPVPGRRAEAYVRAFGGGLTPTEEFVVEERMRRTPCALEDDSADLVEAAPERVRDWMIRKAALADGTRPGTPRANPEAVDRALRDAGQAVVGSASDASLLQARIFSESLRAGLLRGICGLTVSATALRMGLSVARVKLRIDRHRERVGSDRAYADRCARVASDVLRRARTAEAGAEDLRGNRRDCTGSVR